MRWHVRALVMALLLSSSASLAAEPNRQADEKAIRAATSLYIDALNKGDVKTLLDHWTTDGEIVDEFGRATPARKLIEQETPRPEKGADPATPVKAPNSRIRFITNDVAIEEGRTEPSDDEPDTDAPAGLFTAVWVRQADRWRLANLRESHVPERPALDLASLDWMVGTWTGEIDGTTYTLTAHWNEKHTFLEREMSLSREGKVVTSALQHIGLDPNDAQIHSWVHDNEGGHGEGIWSQQGDTWVVRSTGVDSDGQRTSGTSTYTPVDANRLVWKSLAGRSGDLLTPSFEITLTRTVQPKK